MGKVKKILAGVLVVVIAGSGITAGLMQLKKNSQKTVAVTPVSGLLQEFYTPSTTLDGTITSSATQTVNGDKDLIIDQIYVTKGDAVKKGDPLVSFDTTLVEMELNIAKLKKQKLEQDLNKAVNRLNSLQNGGPVEETDAGTDADNLNSKTGKTDNDTGDDDMTPMIRYHPQQICPAVTWQQPCIRFYYLLLQMEMQWIMRAQTILHPSQIYREMMLQQIPEIQAVHQVEHLRIMIFRYIRIPQRMDSATERRMILIQEK